MTFLNYNLIVLQSVKKSRMTPWKASAHKVQFVWVPADLNWKLHIKKSGNQYLWLDFLKGVCWNWTKGSHFVAKTPNFKPPPKLPFACSESDALSFKRQDIGRSFFLISQIFIEQFFCAHRTQLKRWTIAWFWQPFPVISGFTFKKHATLTYCFRFKLITTKTNDCLECSAC